jgi:zinc/manganese transport system substrate-binding protein
MRRGIVKESEANMNRRQLLRTLGLGLVATALAGAAIPARAADKIRVVATTTDVGSILQTVGGDRVQVTTIAKGYQDPHYVDPKPSFIVDLRRAKVVAYVGLQLEIGWLPLLVEGAHNQAIVAGAPGNIPMSQGIDLLEVPTGGVSRAGGDIHPEGNPHYWLDPRNMIQMAKTAEAGLSRVDPAGAATYAANRDTFVKKLESQIPVWEKRMEPHRGKMLVCYHKEYEYLARWLGLQVVDYVESKPGIPPSPRHLQELEQTMKEKKVPVMVASVFVRLNDLQGLAQRTGAQLVVLPPSVAADKGTDDPIALFDTITSDLDAAFRKGGS